MGVNLSCFTCPLASGVTLLFLTILLSLLTPEPTAQKPRSIPDKNQKNKHALQSKIPFTGCPQARIIPKNVEKETKKLGSRKFRVVGLKKRYIIRHLIYIYIYICIYLYIYLFIYLYLYTRKSPPKKKKNGAPARL